MSNLYLLELIGIPAIFIGGVFFHFLYAHMGRKKWMAVISPVNESIWEHLKIAFYPVLIYTLIELLIVGPNNVPNNYLTAELVGIYIMILFILITEWIYPLILRHNLLIIDLLIFFLGISFSQLSSYQIMITSQTSIPDLLALAIIILQTLLFTFISFYPPKLSLFRDSVDGKYGIKSRK